MIERACRTPRRRLSLLFPLLLLTAGPAVAQPDPLGTRLINLPTPASVGSRRIELLFTHRFQQTVQDGDDHNLWGLDGGSDVGIGLTWGATPRLDLGVFRSSYQENFEVAAKYRFWDQGEHRPVSLALRAGADLLRREGIEDASRPFLQVVLARQLTPGVSVVLSPSWVRDTPRLRNAFNLPVGVTFPFKKSLIEVEWIPANRDLDDSEDAWHVAISRALGDHIFEILIGNSRATTVDQYLGGDFAGGFDAGDVRFGFNLVRNFDL